MIEEIEKIVGKKNVSVDENLIDEVNTSTYPTKSRINIVVRPYTTAEIQECIKLANSYKLPIYTVSMGKNWGYGSKTPIKDKSILLDLSRMNKILDYDEKQAYVTIEPGVTPKKLHDFLSKKKSSLLISIGGSSPELSLIGNTLERGHGAGPYGDRFNSICGMQIVLPNGNIINTGFEGYKKSKCSKTYQKAPGPYIDGLFSQSNMGIVTRLTMWLMPCPNYIKLIYFTISDDEKFAKVINEFQNMFINGLIEPTLTLFNSYRLLTSFFNYPRNEEIAKKSNKELRIYLENKLDLKPKIQLWNGDVWFRGQDIKYLNQKAEFFSSSIENYIVDSLTIDLTKDEILEIRNSEQTTISDNVISSFLMEKYIGIPNYKGLKQAYWRKPKSDYELPNPDRDNCGIIWIAPIVPFNGEDILKASKIINNLSEKFGFQSPVSILGTQARSVHLFSAIIWDREIKNEDELAMQCYEEIINSLKSNGYYSYRISTHLMDKLPNDDSLDFLNCLKHCLDPNNILSPGRYGIGR